MTEQDLRAEFASLLRRIKNGKPGVSLHRARLRQVRHELMKKEIEDGAR